MAKMWTGRTSGETSEMADSFNSSIAFDQRMYRQDITGSMAHAKMLAKQEIITESEADAIIEGLAGILDDIESGELPIRADAEDIHMFVEEELTNRIGETGKKLHTARSRNDQVALDLRLYLREQSLQTAEICRKLIRLLADKAEAYIDCVMPGYTHLQRAQPILFSHQLLAYAQMLKRDTERLEDLQKRINVSPIGSCALAGTTFPTDRFYEADLLGMEQVCENSLDGVSDRDFVLELASDYAILMMHLSRFSEEILLWTSWEFRFVSLSDAFTTGSSIMPQKKNSDMAELVRGKTGRVYGNLVSLLTTMKGIPLAYNKDMQEDKEPIFDSCDTVYRCLEIFCGMIETMEVHPDNMRKAAMEGFINATDLADYLVVKGLPFRTAYKISGSIVRACIESGKTLETFPLSEYQTFSDLIAEDVYEAIDLDRCVNLRSSYGGTSRESVRCQIRNLRESE